MPILFYHRISIFAVLEFSLVYLIINVKHRMSDCVYLYQPGMALHCHEGSDGTQ